MKAKLYLESTFPSYYVARPSKDLVLRAHQAITRNWWKKRLRDFEVHVSDVALDEIALGEAAMAKKRLDLVRPFPLLAATDASRELTRALIETGPLPEKAARDAAHIALSAVHEMHFLLTWNCRHIANAEMLRKIEQVCGDLGFKCPVVCTPDELLGGK